MPEVPSLVHIAKKKKNAINYVINIYTSPRRRGRIVPVEVFLDEVKIDLILVGCISI